MATFSVVIRKEAETEFLSVPFPFRRQLNQLIFKLKEEPRPAGSELVDGNLFRVETRGWVVLYEIDDEEYVLTLVAFRKAVGSPAT